MTAERKPILCLDFDGVLHSYVSGWKGAGTIPDPPVPGAVEACREYAEHFKIVVNSSRCSERAGIGAIFEWLDKYGFPVEAMEIHAEKPPAVVTLDDRAICFEGIFPPVETLIGFQPWNKRAPRCAACGLPIVGEAEECTAGKIHPECYDSPGAQP